ncbi:hypothetical protein [Simkania sp.]|uniref:hypothetical protein n=1 Tax=Simkania sp. TaxID=34094 RepID=UPI003B528094
MSLRLTTPPNTQLVDWLTGFAHHKQLLVRVSSRYLAQAVVWLQMSTIFQAVFNLFFEVIVNPVKEKFYPVQPLLPSSVSKIEADSLQDLQRYILSNVTPYSQQINLKLRQVEDLSSSESEAKKRLYQEGIALYHQMSPHIETASKWLNSHKQFETDHSYIEIKSELREAAMLVNKIAKLNAEALFLRQRSDCPPPLSRPIGLVNENRNDCFMNAIRQLMFNIKVLRKCVLEKLPAEKYSQILANAALYFLAQRRGETTPIGGSSASREEVDMQTGRQEDAFEALGQLLSDISDVEKVNPHLPLSPANVEEHNPLLFWTANQKRVEIDGNYEDFSEAEKMRISEAGWLSVEQTPNSSVILDLKGVDTISLEKALKRWAFFEGRGDTFKVATKDGGTLELPIVEEANRFHDLPPSLILTLKRFERDLGVNKKETRIVDMDETFVLPGDIVNSGKNGRYRIKGFVSHEGNTVDSGHYVSYVFIPESEMSKEGKWYCCDDKVVTEVDIATVREALSFCYFVYSELEREISPSEAKVFLRTRELQTLAVETRLAQEASVELAKLNTPENRIKAAQTDLEMVQLFAMATEDAHAEPSFLTSLFNQLPKDAYRFFLKILEIEKGYSQKDATTHLNELRTIATSYLVREPGDTLTRNIIDQYIYMKEQYILLLQCNEDLRISAEFHLRQLLALQAILEIEAVSAEHVKLVLPYLCDEFQRKLNPHVTDKFDAAALQEATRGLIEATAKILQA